MFDESLDISNPKLIQTLCEDLQRYVGRSPLIEYYPLHLDATPGKLLPILRAQPKTYSEVARVVRAARHLKMQVRAMGGATGGELDTYANVASVLIDLCKLGETPRIRFVQVPNENGELEIPGLRVNASVKVNELSNFLVFNRIELGQFMDNCSFHSTVVGAITASVPGLAGPNSFASGGCLADEVLSISVVNSNGDLVEYTGDHLLKTAAGNFGLLGIVYAVTLRYRPLSLTKVDYHFIPWSVLLDPNNEILRNSIANNQITEITYLPFNSCDRHNHDPRLPGWSPSNDEVMLRTGRVIAEFKATNRQFELDSKCSLRVLDEINGPAASDFVANPTSIPQLLSRAHRNLKERYGPTPTVIQYTPWALDVLEEIVDPLQFLIFTVESTRELRELAQVVEVIFNILNLFTERASEEWRTFWFNLGLRIHFTGPRKYGISTRDANPNDIILIHISMTGISLPAPHETWLRAASEVFRRMMNEFPFCIPQWKSEWPLKDECIETYRRLFAPHLARMHEIINVADVDGIFLTRTLAKIFYPQQTREQLRYQDAFYDKIMQLDFEKYRYVHYE